MCQVDPSVSVMVDVQNTLVNNVFSFYANDEVKAWAFPKLAQNTVRVVWSALALRVLH